MKKNIFGVRIGNLLNIIWKGKPKTITADNPEQMEKLVDLVNKSNDGDEQALQELNEKIFPPKEDLVPKDLDTQQLEQDIAVESSKLDDAKAHLKAADSIKELENHPDFEVINQEGDVKYFLKGFKAELPMNIVQKFAFLIAKGLEYLHLIKFWQMNLLNDNPDARRGLYKFLTKQKLIITPEGYFVAFRRLVTVKKGSNSKQSFTNAEITVIEKFRDKIKSWKKSNRNFEVYRDTSTKELFLTKIEQHEKNKAKYEFLGVLYDCLEKIKFDNLGANGETIYTDAYTKTMVIKLNEPVKMSRSKCNSNPHESCSFGLHVGVPTYVSRNTGNGDTIVACLINPMHVISVPYSDAEKMRVCEYFPFMVLTQAELKNFDNIDISVFEKNYKEIENEKLQKSLEVIDNLTPVEKTSFVSPQSKVTQKDVEKLENNLKQQQNVLENKQKMSLTLLDDNVSKSLDLEEIKKIVKARLNK